MNKTLIITAFFLYSFSIFASLPLAQSLFGNNQNPDVEGDVTLVEFAVEKEEAPEVSESKMTDPKVVKNLWPIIFKIIIFKVDNRFKAIQAIYTKNTKQENLLDIYIFEDFEKEAFATGSLLKKLNYGLVHTFLNNESGLLFKTLQEFDPSLKTNLEMINKEKYDLLMKYKHYLENSKNNPALTNPLKPETEESRKFVQEILSQDLYQNNLANIKLTRSNGLFLWNLETQKGLKATFDYKTKKIMDLNVTKEQEDSLDYQFAKYVTFDSKYILPKLIKIKAGILGNFNISTLNYVEFQNKGKTFRERVKEYLDGFSSLKTKTELPDQIRALFICQKPKSI